MRIKLVEAVKLIGWWFGSSLFFGLWATQGTHSRSKSTLSFLEYMMSSGDLKKYTGTFLFVSAFLYVLNLVAQWMCKVAAQPDDSVLIRWCKSFAVWVVLLAATLLIQSVAVDPATLPLERQSTGLYPYRALIQTIAPALILVGLGLLWYFSPRVLRQKRLKAATDTYRAPQVLQRNGYPSLVWAQEVATDDTIATADQKMRWRYWPWSLVIGALYGIYNGGLSGGWGDLFAAIVIFGWLGLHFLRPKAAHDLHNPEQAKREEITPETRREDCEAFIAEHDGTLHFYIARGDKSTGPLPIVDRVPWESFGNFEEGSHKQWFRSRGNASELVDWGVIVVQSSVGRVGRVVNVAESVHSHAWLVELLVTLQNTFVAPRDKMMRDFREAAQKQRAHSGPADHADQTATNDAPVKPF